MPSAAEDIFTPYNVGRLTHSLLVEKRRRKMMTVQDAIKQRAVERIDTCAKYTGVDYGYRCRADLVEAEEERITTALIDLVCPPIQKPLVTPDK